MTEEQNNNQSKTFLATYPVSIFLFFAILLGFNLFLQSNSKKEDMDDKFSLSNVMKANVQAKEDDSKQVAKLINAEDVLARTIYQPVRKIDSVDLEVSATSAVILDVDSGGVLYSKNATEKRSIASLTKLVTAMIVIDRVQNLDEEVVIPESVMTIDGTKVGCLTSIICEHERLYVGEKVRVRDLLTAMLVASANDAATTLAIHISGSEEEFAELMNARMEELGASNSNFCRPSGLELDDEENEEDCYSTAYDISRVVSHLLRYEKYDVIWNILKVKESSFTDVDSTVEHTLESTNRILGEVSNILGGKTGFTPRAGYSLMMSMESSDKKHRIVSIVLDDYSRFDDVQEMAEWAFGSYEWK